MNKKIFSVGINPKWECDEACGMLEKYQDYIKSVFFSPPVLLEDDKIDDFTCIPIVVSPKQVESFYNIINFAKELGFKIDLAANKCPGAIDKVVNNLYENIDKFQPSEMTIVPELKDRIKEKYPTMSLVYSFNASPPTQTEFNQDYDAFVMSRHLL